MKHRGFRLLYFVSPSRIPATLPRWHFNTRPLGDKLQILALLDPAAMRVIEGIADEYLSRRDSDARRPKQ